MDRSLGTTLVVGVGPGLGSALARRFAAAGAPVVVGARTPHTIVPLADALRAEGHRALAVTYDAGDVAAVDAAIDQAQRAFGPVGTLLYNVGNAVRGAVDELSPEQFTAAWRVGPFGAFLHARRLLPAMAQRGQGNIIFTGATSSVRSPAHSPAFGTAKFALRGLAMSLARAWGPRGVHVAHVVVDGVVRTPRTESHLAPGEAALLPEEVAEAYLQLALQPPSAWTFELDLRPWSDDHLDN